MYLGLPIFHPKHPLYPCTTILCIYPCRITLCITILSSCICTYNHPLYPWIEPSSVSLENHPLYLCTTSSVFLYYLPSFSSAIIFCILEEPSSVSVYYHPSYSSTILHWISLDGCLNLYVPHSLTLACSISRLKSINRFLSYSKQSITLKGLNQKSPNMENDYRLNH